MPICRAINYIVISLFLSALSYAAGATTLVYNVSGYTMNDGKLLRFAAIEFDQDRVTRLYESAGELVQSKAETKIDGRGATLLPGLTDAHGHVHNLGLLLQSPSLIGTSSESDAVQRVKSYIETQPEQVSAASARGAPALRPGCEDTPIDKQVLGLSIGQSPGPPGQDLPLVASETGRKVP